MFFLAVLTWATLTTEPPKIVGIFVNDQPHGEALVASAGDKCQIARQQAQHQADFFKAQEVRYICLEVIGDA